ncbi:MAG: sulfurtransferase TusA family protein [Candidatus Melainabacteria bacterium]|nr:sulfurtransferase TusA family protein [Candidatus Melainabacteria bacterium]
MKDKCECPLLNSCVIEKCFPINFVLDLRGVECPLNFVKTKIQLDKMQTNQILEVLLDPGEAIESVPPSVIEEGHKVLSQELFENYYKVLIQKN